MIPLKAYRLLLATPLVVALIGAGALTVNPSAGADLFAPFWWGMTAAVTVSFLTLMRWGFDLEEADDEAAPAAGSPH